MGTVEPLPLIGVVDSQRMQDIMEKTLSRIAESRARVFVMDISGVVTATAVANNFIRITQATRLMGCDWIISGISPNVARTLVGPATISLQRIDLTTPTMAEKHDLQRSGHAMRIAG